MPLEGKYIEYFELQYSKRSTELMAEAAAEIRKADYILPNEQPVAYAKAVKEHAKGVVEARIDAYIETIEKFGIVPSREDYLPLGIELHEIAKKKVDTFVHKLKSPGVLQDKTWQAQAIDHVTREIEHLVALAVPRLKYFIDERALLAEMEGTTSMQDGQSLAEKLLTDDQRLFLETFYDHQRTGEQVSDKQVVAELSEKLGRFVRPEIPGAFFRKDVTILGVALLDPDSRLVRNADNVIKGVRRILRANADQERITSRELADVTSLGVADIEAVLSELERFAGVFHHSGVMSENDGRSAMNVDGTSFDDYMKYDSLGAVLLDRAAISEELEAIQNETTSSVFNVHGDYVMGNQHKPGSVSGHYVAESKVKSTTVEGRGKNRSTIIIGVVTIILAIIAICVAIAIPETRAWSCAKTGYLCSATNMNN